LEPGKFEIKTTQQEVMQRVQAKLTEIFKLREKSTKTQLKREMLNLVLRDELSKARSNEQIMELLRYSLNDITYKKEDTRDV
jgi:hypothetical protein